MGSSVVKNLPAMQEMQVLSLGWEDPLEEDMATHSSILVWRILWTEEPGRLQSMGLQRAGTTEVTELTHAVNAVATSHIWILNIEMWLVQIKMCRKSRIHKGFWRLSLKKKNVYYLINNFKFDCIWNDTILDIGLNKIDY